MSWWNDVRGAVVGTTLAAMGMPEIGYAYYQGETNKKAQKDSEKRQFKYQVELNNMMNEYNTPANQMQRYIDAGMNPYMASVSSGTQGSAGSVSTSAPDLNYGEFANKYQATLNADMDLQLKDLQLASNKISLDMLPSQLQAEIDFKKAQTNNLNAMTYLNQNKSPVNLSDPINYFTYHAKNFYNSLGDTSSGFHKVIDSPYVRGKIHDYFNR